MSTRVPRPAAPVGTVSLQHATQNRKRRHDILYSESSSWVASSLDCRFSESSEEKGVGMFPRSDIVNLSGKHWEVAFFGADAPSPPQCTLAVKAVRPSSSSVLVDMFDLMAVEGGGGRSAGFHNSEDVILDMWKRDMVLVLEIEDSPAATRLWSHPFPSWSQRSDRNYLPALLCLGAPNDCEILWVSESLRCRGAARVILDQADVQRCGVVLKSATPFWDAMRIPYQHVQSSAV